ncbi:MAG: hypothetical protein KDI03_09650 [Anaerolineae bacterium]|nr:hypothetical protein [Anaerolineae bacterium]MCB0206814.1 hypothetical protein [Anaerolineae bacterium]
MQLIDTLSTGFRLVGRRVWLIVLPVVIDLWLLFGPRLSIQPVVDDMMNLWSTDGLPPDLVQTAEPFRQMLAQIGPTFNLWWLLDNSLTWLQTAMPRLSPVLDITGLQATSEVSWLALLLWTPLIAVIGLGLGSAFLTLIASQMPAVPTPAQEPEVESVAAEKKPRFFWLRRGLRTWSMVVVYGLILFVLITTLLFVVSLALTPIMMITPQLASALAALVALVIIWAGLWIYLVLYFVVAALVLDGTGLVDSLRRSFYVVTRNFWSSLGLVILTAVILTGFGLIWQRIAVFSPVGIAVAIGGNALLLTGLTAARLVFYRDRYAARGESPAAVPVK